MRPPSNVLTVLFKPTESQEPQIQRRNVVQDDDFIEQTLNWLEETKVPDKHSAYYDDFIQLSNELQLIWDGHFCRIYVVKHPIELLSDNIHPVHLALYRSEPKMREFEQSKIE